MSQVTEITNEVTAPGPADLLYLVEDPAGTPADGKITVANLRGGVTTVTDTYQILTTDATVVCNKATLFTVTLPADTDAVVGERHTLKNIGAGTVTLEGSGADTIDGGLNVALLQWDTLTVQLSAANTWIII